MKYKMISAALDNAVDNSRVTACVKHYSDGKFGAVLYRYGTFVFPSMIEEKLKDSERRLADVGAKQLSFEVREMDDGNYVVAFNDKVFTVVLHDEYRKLRDQIIKEVKASPVEEILLGKRVAPEDHLYIGLFGRTRLIRDIEELEVVGELSVSS